MTFLRRIRHDVRPRLRLGLFSRSFLLIAFLMLVSLGAWLQIVFNIEEGPRASQLAQRIATTVSITRSALVYAPPAMRPALLLDLATQESLRVQPREHTDVLEPLPHTTYWTNVSGKIRDRLGSQTAIMWSVNQVPGIWISFQINDEMYWLVFDRDQLRLTTGREWLGWVTASLLLALLGAAISVRFINQPLAQLAKVAQQLARGETPTPLPEKGPGEIRDMNIAFNRMARDLRQNEADREIMLAGISHDLRTPLARIRLEIEMGHMTDEARQAIDDDLAQINHSIGQLMEYARPAGQVPEAGIDVSRVLQDLFERERSHTESQGGDLTASIQPGLQARISANDLKRIVSNLIENARRYGRSADDGRAHINLAAHQSGNQLTIEVRDRGTGIPQTDIQRLLRPFARGESARTGVSGAGLGLSIVERLLGQVGGKFTLAPNTPCGLLARIEIPKARPQGKT
ncbi:MAG: ATP-binding protein [Castellaniella sp.]|uniref:ATP-binding protein n=1 Tax=Castellaniella sp. TaxID=1955812 RepID=UPI002A36C695|nr:ATP-binding protein [Castellaniella sp.]MDY0308426.1 ATP-binding protein [Castellaniella sp.]